MMMKLRGRSWAVGLILFGSQQVFGGEQSARCVLAKLTPYDAEIPLSDTAVVTRGLFVEVTTKKITGIDLIREDEKNVIIGSLLGSRKNQVAKVKLLHNTCCDSNGYWTQSNEQTFEVNIPGSLILTYENYSFLVSCNTN
jgi:hypothetical protein